MNSVDRDQIFSIIAEELEEKKYFGDYLKCEIYSYEDGVYVDVNLFKDDDHTYSIEQMESYAAKIKEYFNDSEFDIDMFCIEWGFSGRIDVRYCGSV